MSPISKYTHELLSKKDLTQEDLDWIIEQIETLHIQFNNPAWDYTDPDSLHTHKQVGYLSSIMDLTDPDRYECLEIILGFRLSWDPSQFYPGRPSVATEEDGPRRSSKDLRITRWINSQLIDYFVNGQGHQFNAKLKYRAKSDIRREKRAARQAAKEAALAAALPAGNP